MTKHTQKSARAMLHLAQLGQSIRDVTGLGKKVEYFIGSITSHCSENDPTLTPEEEEEEEEEENRTRGSGGNRVLTYSIHLGAC